MAPAERVGATGMRPSFGVIGRSGVMTLVDSLVRPCTLRKDLQILQACRPHLTLCIVYPVRY